MGFAGSKNLVYASGLWFAGKDERNVERSAMTWYFDSDFWPGTIRTPFIDSNLSAASDPSDSKFRIALLSDSSSANDTSYQRWVGNASITGAPLRPDGSPKLLGQLNS